MTYPKMKPCPKCSNADVELYGYGDWPPLDWYVECDDCLYRGPIGNKLQAIRQHNAHVAQIAKNADDIVGERRAA